MCTEVKSPTYQDLIEFLPNFASAEMDIRVFRTPKRFYERLYGNIFTKDQIDSTTTEKLWKDVLLTRVSGAEPFQTKRELTTERVICNGKEKFISFFYIGDWPVEKKFDRNTTITSRFINDEIHKIREQKEFDKTVKPYPHRDAYYQLLINDLKDLLTLSNFWIDNHRQPIVKRGVNNVGGGGGGGIKYLNKFI